MGSVSLNLAAGFLAILLTVAIVLRTQTYFRLRHIPGPPLAAISEFWLLRKTLGGRLHLDTAQACRKYGRILAHTGGSNTNTDWRKKGSVVRVGPNMLVTDDPEIFKRLSLFDRHTLVLTGMMACASKPITVMFFPREMNSVTMNFEPRWLLE
jgi:hypothetical protein